MKFGRVLITRTMPAGSLDPVAASGYTLDTHDGLEPLPHAQLLESAAGCAAMLTTLADAVDTEVLDAAGPQLRVVANCAVGYHNIDLHACDARDVIVTNTPDVLTAATADFAFALLIAAARRLVQGDRLVRAETPWQWAPTFMLGADVTGSRLGLLGFGRIGQALARRAAGFDMTVQYFKPAPAPTESEQLLGARWMPLDDLLASSDHLIICCPLTPQTRHLIDEQRLRLLPPGATLVSITAGVIDEDALAAVLDDGHLIGVAIDNHEHEPAVHPLLRNHERCILTPHLGSATESTRRQMADLAVANILAVLGGDVPLSRVPLVDHRPGREEPKDDPAAEPL